MIKEDIPYESEKSDENEEEEMEEVPEMKFEESTTFTEIVVEEDTSGSMSGSMSGSE